MLDIHVKEVVEVVANVYIGLRFRRNSFTLRRWHTGRASCGADGNLVTAFSLQALAFSLRGLH